MLAAAASLLNIDVVVLDVGEHTPAKQVVAPRAPSLAHIDGSFADSVKIRKLASKVDVLTVEIEHVDVGVLEEIEGKVPLGVHPSPFTIKTIQDKFVQKEHLRASGCPVSDFLPVESTVEAVKEAAERLGLPLMLKSRTLAYDGRGNFVVRDLKQAQEAITALGNRPLYAEKWVSFVKEIAVMVVRSREGEVISYPVVETVHKENICHLVFAPLRSRDPSIAERARTVAENAVKTLQGAGVFGVEMFLMADGSVYLNEIAPRPHNSGHYTIEACETSQYENHLRAILSLPLGSPALKVPSACMLNILGASSSMDEIREFAQFSLTVPGARVHLYGKSDCRKGRKMGHITLVADSDAELSKRLRPLLEHLPGGHDPKELELYAPLFPERGFSHRQPVVGVIMGSDSDLPTMLPAADILNHFKIPYELTIVSAHRTPDRLVEYARSAASRGLRVIIAGAGGRCSFACIVQMPRGIPVATVAINNGTNAGLLAVRILSAGQPHLVTAMDDYLKTLEKEVLAKVDKITEIGWDAYESARKARSG
ncbi:hypothetical protein ONZ51_g2527 [Trametes cubensis]|uniref:Phosphoribosylaminoimidazole carboxylase n=1 Tax=Trametes cubensis TaxID=1111947 RepID=A0AAD7TZZ6_9APHY|nr:hypothetical protein ONZ51_g2527 [Trametes cubensis]